MEDLVLTNFEILQELRFHSLSGSVFQCFTTLFVNIFFPLDLMTISFFVTCDSLLSNRSIASCQEVELEKNKRGGFFCPGILEFKFMFMPMRSVSRNSRAGECRILWWWGSQLCWSAFWLFLWSIIWKRNWLILITPKRQKGRVMGSPPLAVSHLPNPCFLVALSYSPSAPSPSLPSLIIDIFQGVSLYPSSSSSVQIALETQKMSLGLIVMCRKL